MKQKKAEMRDYFLKKIIFSLIGMPILLLSIDSDLENMHLNDANRMKVEETFITARTGYAYSEWKMQNMGSFKQETQGLNLAWIDLIYKGNMADIDGTKNYLHYERSFNKNWNEKIIYQEDTIKDKDNYELLSGRFTLPFSYDNPIFIEGTTERYLSRILSKGNTGFINQKGELYNLRIGDSLVFETKFNEIIVGTQPTPSSALILFFNDYQKPFTVRRNNDEITDLSHLLFYSKIKTYGFGIEFEDNQESYKGVLVGLTFKVGWSDIELIDDIKLTDLEFKNSQYFQFKLRLGYSFIPIKSIKSFNVNVLGTYDVRYFHEPDSEGKTTMFSTEGGTNKDDIMKAFVSLQYSF
jgi:hypothetical protein